MPRWFGVVTIVCLLALSACGDGDDGSDAAPSPTGSATAESSSPSAPAPSESEPSETAPSESEPVGQVIEITFEGDSVTPNGERVEVQAGELIDLRITADAPGEIHVHSSPEQDFEYGPGRTRLQLTIERPGVVDVESHDLALVIVQLEVRP